MKYKFADSKSIVFEISLADMRRDKIKASRRKKNRAARKARAITRRNAK